MDSENEKLVVREPEDEDGECQASQNSAGSLWTALSAWGCSPSFRKFPPLPQMPLGCLP